MNEINHENRDDISRLQNKVGELNRQIEDIENRNRRVEADKAWETSTFRVLTITAVTYIIAVIVMYAIKVSNPFTSALIPTIGFFLSTQSLPIIKRRWIKRKTKLKIDSRQ